MRARDQTDTMLRWWQDAGIDRADLAIRRPNGSMAWHRELHLDSLPLSWARAENVRQADVYIRPARGFSWPLVFLDDVLPARASAIAHKYAAIAIQTSQAGGCHVWLRCSTPLPEDLRAQAQRWLVSRIGADTGSVSGEHLGRLAGFRNWKRAGVWVNVIIASAPDRPWDPRPALGDIPVSIAPSSTRSQQPATTADTSPSGREWGWVCGLLEAGIDPTTVHARLVEQARPRRGSDAERYASYTLARAMRRCAPPLTTRDPRQS